MSSSNWNELNLNIRIQLAFLWTAVMFCYVYGDYFALYIPGHAEKLVNGDTLLNSPMKLFAASVLMAVPPLVIIASVMARAKLVRVLNIVFGIVYTGIMLLIAISYWPVPAEASAYVFYALLESVITLVIVRSAWRWQRN